MTDTEALERSAEMRAWYESHRFKCQIFEERIANHLEHALRNASLDDATLDTRTKRVDSYVAKSLKRLSSGEFKYSDPRTEITDAVGARILVPLSTDLPGVVSMLKATYLVDEELERGDEEGHVDVPGYRSLHFLVRLNQIDRQSLDFREFGDMSVEVQLRTQLQHAWASLQHDLMYKTERAPTPAIRRRLVSLAGLLELADREFVAVRQAHSELRDQPAIESPTADMRLTAAALRHLAETIFGEEDPAAQDWFVELQHIVRLLGLETAADLDRALGDWRGRGPRVAAVVRAVKPWVNSAYLLDLLLRLSLRETYVDARLADSYEGEDSHGAAHRAKDALLIEVRVVDRELASTT